MTTIPAPTEGLTPTKRLVPPATPTMQELSEMAGAAVNRASALAGEVADLHTSAVSSSAEIQRRQIEQDAQKLTGEGVPRLLGRLADRGLAWRDIAALAGVSVPAVRKWRQGGSASGANLLRVAWLVALMDWLEEEKVIADVASWLEVPLLASAPVTRLDLLLGDRADLVIESLTGDETPPDELLDQFDPEWRNRYHSDFEVFEADDGLQSIRRREAR